MRLFTSFACVALLATSTALAQAPEIKHQRTVSETPTTRPSVEPLGIALESYDYPHPVKFLEMENNNQIVRMGYMDIDPRGTKNGRSVLLLHGKNFGGYYWKDTIDAFADQGYRVIVPDQVGWGKSSKPDMHYSFDTLANNTAKLLDSLKVDKAIVLGHSTGGMLAVKFATMFPARVEKLILEGPLGMEDYTKYYEAPNVETLYAAELKEADEKQIRDMYAAYFVDPKHKAIDTMAEIPIRVRLSGEYPRWAKASALQYQMIHEQPVRSSYATLTMPTLIVVGDKDKTVPLAQYVPAEQRQGLGNYPKLAIDAANEIPNGKAVVIKDCGHVPHLEKPSEFHSTVLNFAKEGTTVTATE